MEITAAKTATSLAASMKMGPDKTDEVRMAVVEACINAFEHSGAPDRMVYLNFVILGEEEPDVLRITVRDSGSGFDPVDLEEPRIVDKLHASNKRGWGLKIIEGLMDDVEIQTGDNGTAVIMTKAR